jgi:hypothetical protein
MQALLAELDEERQGAWELEAIRKGRKFIK